MVFFTFGIITRYMYIIVISCFGSTSFVLRSSSYSSWFFLLIYSRCLHLYEKHISRLLNVVKIKFDSIVYTYFSVCS